MAKTKVQKGELLKELKDIVKTAQSIIFVGFDRLLVKDETNLRGKLFDNNVSYKVVKKSLLKKALEDSSVSGVIPELPGMMAIAYGEDLLAPARESYGFQVGHKDVFGIKGGVFEGKFMSQTEMLSIATIPPIKVLRGMFVNVINSPIGRFAIALGEIAKTKTV